MFVRGSILIEPKPWRPGDPIAPGLLILLDKKIKTEYALECRRQILEAAARQIVNTAGKSNRKRIIDKYPAALREELKKIVLQYWEMRRNNEENKF